jgi:hypothetical protein
MMTVAGLSGDARAEVLEKTTFKGAFAFAFFELSTPITCADGTAGTLLTFVDVFGNEQLFRSRALPDQATNAVTVDASRSNSCTGDFVFGTATVNNAFTQSALQSASLVANLTLLDGDGNPVGTVAVNLSLQGTGPTSSNQSRTRSVFEGPNGEQITSTTHTKGTFRNATPSGSVVLDGVETIGGFQFGSLQQVKDGSGELLKS